MPSKKPIVQRKKLKSVITKAVNNLIFTLDIKTTKTAPQRGMLLNRFEEPDSQIKEINVSDVTYYDREEIVPYSRAELKQMPGYTEPTMTFMNVWRNMDTNEITGTTSMTFNKEGGFSCWDVVQNILAFEKLDRPKSRWFGGVDCHHIFYEGICFNDDKTTLAIRWGS
tara:strand:+ start:105 stop:608 length:504 start_codon:yes stop_codon:yes gene_type:complete